MKNNTIIRAGDRFTKNAAAKTESKKTAMDNLLSLIAKPEACLNSPSIPGIQCHIKEPDRAADLYRSGSHNKSHAYGFK